MGVQHHSSNIKLERKKKSIIVNTTTIDLKQPDADALQEGLSLLRDELVNFDDYREEIIHYMENNELSPEKIALIKEDLDAEERELSKVQDLLVQLEDLGIIEPTEDVRTVANIKIVKNNSGSDTNLKKPDEEAGPEEESPIDKIRSSLTALETQIKSLDSLDKVAKAEALANLNGIKTRLQPSGKNPKTTKMPTKKNLLMAPGYELFKGNLADLFSTSALMSLRRLPRPDLIAIIINFVKNDNFAYTNHSGQYLAQPVWEEWDKNWSWENSKGKHETMTLHLSIRNIENSSNKQYTLKIMDGSEDAFGYGPTSTKILFTDVDNPNNIKMENGAMAGLQRKILVNRFVETLVNSRGDFVINPINETS